MKTLLITLAAVGLFSTSVAVAQTPAPAAVATASAKPYYSTESLMGDLLDNPATKAILVKIVPDLVNNEQIDQARGMTLAQLQQYAADMLPDEKLKAIDRELAAVPAPKP